MSATPRSPSLLQALLPLLFLTLALAVSLRFFGENSSYGPNQLALMLAALLALCVGLYNGRRWKDMEQGIHAAMQVVFAPILILLTVGSMIALWVAAGIVPTLIHYGLLLLQPDWFYAASCLVCAVVSLSIGSSWTTAASVGLALMGTATALGLSPAIAAGAVVSGAYFGDKMSPLSDTTNLAPAVVGVDLFEHIRHMVWTGLPALLLALLLFLLIGHASETGADAGQLLQTQQFLAQNFTLGWYLLLPLVLLFICAWRRMPALPALVLAGFAGACCAWWFQPGVFTPDSSRLQQLWQIAVGGYESATGDFIMDELLSGGGAANMLETVWLILCAVFFGAAMEQTGLLRVLIRSILRLVHSTTALITATVLTGIGANIVTGDQYIAIVLPGRMFREAYREFRLAPVNLSRALEDSSTVTSALVPWNTCGAFMAVSLGVATLDYLPYAFFNLVMPLISILYGYLGFRIKPLSDTALPQQAGLAAGG
jgi:NhaC family Na+:H+ antiporter